MELLDAHREAMRGFDWTIHQVGADQWEQATPCARWTVRDLVNHLVSEQLWVPDLLGGATLAQVGDKFDGDVLGSTPVAAWEDASTEARAAWTAPGSIEGTVYVTGAQIDRREYGWQMTVDLAVHGWDLARAIGAEHPINAPVAQQLLDHFADQVDSMQDVGIIAAPVQVAADADAASRLVGLLGRSPSWPDGQR